MKPKKINSVLCGVAGEYLVAGELSRQGYIASITLRNTKGVDILVSNANATKSAGIQVKTSQGSSKAWILGQKAEEYHAKTLFYVFVNLNKGNAPDFFVVPSRVVAKSVQESHQKWLAVPGKKGQKHKDNPMRVFKDSENKYLNRWDLLKL